MERNYRVAYEIKDLMRDLALQFSKTNPEVDSYLDDRYWRNCLYNELCSVLNRNGANMIKVYPSSTESLREEICALEVILDEYNIDELFKVELDIIRKYA